MINNRLTIVLSLLAILFGSCQDKDFDMSPMALETIDGEQISGSLNGDDYTWTWPQLSSGHKMLVTLYTNGTQSSSDTVAGTSYVQQNVNTNTPYTYVFKVSDGTNLSEGVVKTYTREGAAQLAGLQISQLEKSGGYDALVTWTPSDDTERVSLIATNGSRTITETLSPSVTSYTIPDVKYGEEWNVTARAENAKGQSLASTASLKIGKTAMAFLSTHKTPDDLVANGDDDEASAWLWLHKTYPAAKFLCFGDIKQRSDIDPYRVMFWLRDLDSGSEADVWNMPEIVEQATPIIQSWYKDGGNLLLWQHATAYIATLGRLDKNMMQGNDHNIGIGAGSYNPDIWAMATSLNAGGNVIDFSSHPIYKNLPVYTAPNGIKMLAVKGPGWTEDHNCLYFNLPAVLTGKGNQDMACYNEVTQTYGIYPLGVWDSQVSWISQLNVWEARQGNTDFKGTVICVGNGGCSFSMKNGDGTKDVSAYPKNNIYQETILGMAKNSLEYLKTR